MRVRKQEMPKTFKRVRKNLIQRKIMSYYHYTKGSHLSSIVKDGMIKTTNRCCEEKEKPAAWLSKSLSWEVACNIGIFTNEKLVVGDTKSMDEIDSIPADYDYVKKEIGMCRILINETFQTISWKNFKHVSGISKRGYNAWETYSKGNGSSTDQWLCTFSPIPKKYWEGIEMYVNDQWVKWDEKTLIEEFIEFCLRCNGSQELNEWEKNKKVSKQHCQSQVYFIDKYKDEIIEFWEANKHKKGYIEIYVTPDYKPYECGFSFKEKRVHKSTFNVLGESSTGDCALVHFLWEATFNQYRMALAYEVEHYKSNDEKKSKYYEK